MKLDRYNDRTEETTTLQIEPRLAPKEAMHVVIPYEVNQAESLRVTLPSVPAVPLTFDTTFIEGKFE